MSCWLVGRLDGLDLWWLWFLILVGGDGEREGIRQVAGEVDEGKGKAGWLAYAGDDVVVIREMGFAFLAPVDFLRVEVDVVAEAHVGGSSFVFCLLSLSVWLVVVVGVRNESMCWTSGVGWFVGERIVAM